MADLEKKNANVPAESADKKADAKAKKSPKKSKPKLTERIAKFFRSSKSELKKITWSPWNQVGKNTLVVIVTVVICAAAIGLLDLVFNQGIVALGALI